MTGRSSQFDVVVVGAGTAGANAAYQLARRGLAVALVEKRELDAAGAQWHNGVLERHFERAGLEPPGPAERRPRVPRFHLFGPTGRAVLQLEDPPTVAADMAALGRRLRTLAVEAGVKTYDQALGVTPVLANGRVVAIEFGTAPELRLEAALFVDASGRRGVLRRNSPALQAWCTDVTGDELCSASDFEFGISDRAGARAFLERHGARPGDSLSTVGLAGGFSTRGLTISPDLDRVSVLVGCLANGRYGTGPAMLAAVRKENPWIGEVHGGGSGLIPLRRPYARFTAPGLALVGDAACQVFPAHGSGIGMGLIAGSILAATVAPGKRSPGPRDIGDETLLWHYQHAFMHEFGGLLANYEGVRRMSTALGSSGTAALLESGVMSEKLTRAGLDQRLATPDPVDLPLMAARLARRPKLAGRVLPALARSRLAALHGAAHPREPDMAALARWDRRMRQILGPLPS